MRSVTLSIALVGSALASPLDPRQNTNFGGSTQNGLANSGGGAGCKSAIIVFARGTTEQGNVGMVAGPPFFQALAPMVNNDLAVQGVQYPANVQGFTQGGDANGSKLMAQLLKQAVTSCPNSAVVAAGYSQGGQLVHNAATMLDSTTQSKIAAAVIFGDPNNGKPVGSIPASKTKVICHQGDNICQGGSLILQPHLTYGNDAKTAAAFVAQAMGGGARKTTT